MTENVYVDRYFNLGAYPIVETMCYGQCEGTGFVPTKKNCLDQRLSKAWAENHKDCNLLGVLKSLAKHREKWYWKSVLRDLMRGRICDGWHFVTCPDCNGSGKRKTE